MLNAIDYIKENYSIRYGCDGIDLDIEEGAGNQPESGANMVYFVNKLRSIKPDIVIGKNLHTVLAKRYEYSGVPITRAMLA